MQFSELVIQRRSVRKYTDKPVSTDLLIDLINDSLLAPSAGNEQPWKFIIVSSKSLLLRISNDCKQNILKRIKKNPNDYAGRYFNMLSNDTFNIFYNAPGLIFILGECHVKNLQLDCALAASYLMMSAASKGLGTCWINFAREIKDQDILSEIGIPENHSIVAPIIVGYPEVVPPVPGRNKAIILKVCDN